MKFLRQIVLLMLIGAASQAANAEWVKQNSGSLAWLRDITFVNPTNGWIVGSDGVILTTKDGGISWKPAPKFTTDNLHEIHFTDENTGWMLCERSVYSRGQAAMSYLRKTTDGGRTWERVEFKDGGRERVTKLLFNKLGWGTAFGEGGIFYRLQDDGTTWMRSGTAIHFLLLGGAFGDGASGAIAGAGGTILYTDDSGLTWEKATLLGNTDSKFNSIFFVGQKTGWAVGSNGSVITATGGGRLWRAQNSGTTANLNDVFFQSARSGWAVGDDGTIIRTQNGGANWYEVNSHIKHRLERVYFNGDRGWAVGFGGTILSYTDTASVPRDGRPAIRPKN